MNICQQCKGKGAHFMLLSQGKGTPYKFDQNHNCKTQHWVVCDFPGCHKGIVNTEENYKTFI